MARARMVSPSISTDDRIRKLPCPLARLLFTWMILHADNRGRLRGEPGLLRMLVIPYERAKDVEVALWLKKMAELGLLDWYDHGGGKFVQLRSWEKHQDLKRIGKGSDYPDPPLQGIAEHCNALQGIGTEVEVEVEVEGEVEAETHLVNGVDRGSVASVKELKREWTETFDEGFWPTYPRKVAKDVARIAWNKIALPETLAECETLYSEIMSGLRWYVAEEWADRETGKIPHASTWLNQTRWRDRLVTERT